MLTQTNITINALIRLDIAFLTGGIIFDCVYRAEFLASFASDTLVL